MSKKLFLTILIPALLLIAGYTGLQAYLRTSVSKEEEKQNKALQVSDSSRAKTDTLGGKDVSAADLRPLFIQRMQQLLKKSSNGLYDLAVGDMKVDVLASNISLHNVEVKPNQERVQSLRTAGLLPPQVFSIRFKSFLIEGINLDDALTSKTMDYKLVKLVNPEIHIEQSGKQKEPKSNEDFSQRFLKEMEKLSIKNLVVQGGNIVVADKQKGTTKKLAGVQVQMANILLNPETRQDKDRFLFAREARIDFSDFHTRSKDGFYDFKIGNVSVNAPQKKVTLRNLSYGSALSKEAFTKKQKVAKEMYNLSLPSLTIRGIDWWQALNGEEMIASEVALNGGRFYTYLDKALPPTNKMGKFPSQLLAKLPFRLSVDRLLIRDFDIAYEERNPLSAQSGTVYFDQATIDISHLRSNSSKQPVVVKSSALFMHKVPFRADFSFDMSQPQSGNFTATLHAGSLEGSLLNPFVMPVGMVKIEKGSLQSLDATIRGNEKSATSDVLMLYKDLKMAMLQKDKGKAALDKKSVTSFVANIFVLKNENPKGNKAPRREQGSFQRDPTGGFMMLVWKTALAGMLKTMGAPEKMAKKKQ